MLYCGYWASRKNSIYFFYQISMKEKMSALVLAGAMAAGCAGVGAETQNQWDGMYETPLARQREWAHGSALRSLGVEKEGSQADGSHVHCIRASDQIMAAEFARRYAQVGLMQDVKVDEDAGRITFKLLPFPEFNEIYPGVKIKIGAAARSIPDDEYTVCVKAAREGVAQVMGE